MFERLITMTTIGNAMNVIIKTTKHSSKESQEFDFVSNETHEKHQKNQDKGDSFSAFYSGSIGGKTTFTT